MGTPGKWGRVTTSHSPAASGAGEAGAVDSWAHATNVCASAATAVTSDGARRTALRLAFGCTSFSIEPYQLGRDNDEGIESGAWWFYRKLGFRRLLTAMAISIAIRCEPCIRAYVKMACDKGITQEELIEFLEVAMTMQGCPGEEWALKAYAAYKGCLDGRPDSDVSGCCEHQPLTQNKNEEGGS